MGTPDGDSSTRRNPPPGPLVAALEPPLRTRPPPPAPAAGSASGLELGASVYAGVRAREGGTAPEAGLLARAGPVFLRGGWHAPVQVTAGGYVLEVSALSAALGARVPVFSGPRLDVHALASAEVERVTAGGRTRAAGAAAGGALGGQASLLLPAGFTLDLLAQVVWLPAGIPLSIREVSGTQAQPALDRSPGLRAAFALSWGGRP